MTRHKHARTGLGIPQLPQHWLTAALRARTWLPSVEFQDEIRRILRQAGFAEVDMSFSCDRTPQALWTRVTALKQYIADWEVRRGGPCLGEHNDYVLGEVLGYSADEIASFRAEGVI